MASEQTDEKQPRQIDWKELLDGKPRRFKRGKHYVGMADGVIRQAREAAETLDKKAVTVKDQIGKYEHVWVQFLDGKIEEGDPCPRCGATSLEKLQEFFAHCPSCGALCALSPASKSYGPDPAEVAEVTGGRLLSAAGEETEELNVDEEGILEATCRFHRAAMVAQPHFTLFRGALKVLRTGCPDVIGISGPQTLRFTVQLAPHVLQAGDYRVTPNVEMLIEDERQERFFLKIDMPDAFTFRMIDPDEQGARPPSDTARSPLHWTMTLPGEDEPPPVVELEPRARPERDSDADDA
jgi:hypothetical protein